MFERDKIPTSFSVDKNFDNDKFLKLRLKICHDARSLHNTKFKTDSLNSAEATIANVPILAHVLENDEGELEIGGHDIVIEEDKFDSDKNRQIYLEQPVGLIPETNNYEVVEEDGLHYVYCDGYIWKGYSNYCIDIIENSDRIKLSMEVEFLDYHYSRFDDCYVISDFKYTGITLLGGEHRPAMQNSGATIVGYSNSDNLGIVTVEEMCNEVSKAIGVADSNYEKGEINMDSDTIKKILDELGVTEGELDFKITEDMTEGELRTAVENYLKKKGEENSVSEPVQETPQEPTTVSDTVPEGTVCNSVNEPIEAPAQNTSYYSAENRSITFAMSDEDKREAIYRALTDTSDDEYWICQTFDDYAIVQSWMESKFYKVKYSKNENGVTIDPNFVEVYSVFVTAEEKTELDNMRANYSALETEVGELRNYKTDIETANRNAALESLFAKFDDKLAECEEYSTLKTDNSNYSVDEIEEKCYAMLGRIHSTFAADKNDVVINRVSFSYHGDNVERKPYGGLFEAFGKN